MKELKQQVTELILKGEYKYIGIRYEDKERQINEVCENSKDNPDREDEREFPEFGSEEYEELPELAGTSAWTIHNEDNQGITPDYDDEDDRESIIEELDWDNFDSIDYSKHVYIIGSNEESTDRDLCDPCEIVICDAKVLMVVK